MKNIGIITQARMTSTRLPGKILKTIKNKSLLQYHIERLQQTGLQVCIATTTNETDDAVCAFAEKKNISYHRGSEHHVLSRFYEAAVKFDFDAIVRVTSDCPLIDPHLVSGSIEKYLQMNDPQLYLSNVVERSFARGLDFEIFSFHLLDEAFKKATVESDFEHVTPYIWKNRSGKIVFFHIKQQADHSKLRITVDTAEDFELIRLLIEQYHAHTLSYREIEALLLEHPELIRINAHIDQKF